MNITSHQLRPDHINIIVKENAPEAERLKENGFFISDIISRHPGLGTRAKLIYFQNFYIGLLWIEDENIFMKSMLPLYKNRRLPNMKTGMALYDKKYNGSELPFKTINYCCEWMEPGSCFKIAEAGSKSAPLYFILPGYMAFNSDKTKNKIIKPLANHENKIKKLSNVKVFFEGRELNNAEKYLKQLSIIDYESGKGNYIELEFDYNKKGKEINLIKELSVKIKY